MSVLDMIPNNMKGGSTSGILGNVEYLSIAIIPSSTLTLSVITCSGLIEMFDHFI